ncbi:MAG: hypothetical protein QXX68_03540 [Candidatus Pacearchaeota archaeon]
MKIKIFSFFPFFLFQYLKYYAIISEITLKQAKMLLTDYSFESFIIDKDLAKKLSELLNEEIEPSDPKNDYGEITLNDILLIIKSDPIRCFVCYFQEKD